MYAIAFLIGCFTAMGVIVFIDFIKDVIAHIRLNNKRKSRIRQRRGVYI